MRYTNFIEITACLPAEAVMRGLACQPKLGESGTALPPPRKATADRPFFFHEISAQYGGQLSLVVYFEILVGVPAEAW